MRLMRWIPLAMAVPLLGGCVDDRVAYQNDSNQIITLIREQHRVWDKTLALSLVVARMPDCMRRHAMGSGSTRSKIELWQYRPDTFIVKVDDRLYATETRTCEGWEVLKQPPEDGLGTQVGVFREEQGTMAFVPAQSAKGGG